MDKNIGVSPSFSNGSPSPSPTFTLNTFSIPFFFFFFSGNFTLDILLSKLSCFPLGGQDALRGTQRVYQLFCQSVWLHAAVENAV